MAGGPLLPCVPFPPSALSPSACGALTSELPRHRAGMGDQGHGCSQTQTPDGARTNRAAQVAALRPALDTVLWHKRKVRSFTGLQLSLAELPHNPRGGGQDYKPCGLVIRRSHADSICNTKKLAPKTAAGSREWSLFLQAVPSNPAPEGLHLQSLIRICFPCSVSKVTPPSSPPKSLSLVTPAHALP